MGQAEQRQVRTGVADRVRRDTEVADVQEARLAAIRERRRLIGEHDQRRTGYEKALRAEVGLAILNPDPPSDADIAAAARWQLGDVADLRAQLLASPPSRGEGA